jgi:hypothetical protein
MVERGAFLLPFFMLFNKLDRFNPRYTKPPPAVFMNVNIISLDRVLRDSYVIPIL